MPTDFPGKSDEHREFGPKPPKQNQFLRRVIVITPLILAIVTLLAWLITGKQGWALATIGFVVLAGFVISIVRNRT